MFRFLLLVLVVFLAVIIHPTWRGKVLPYAQPALDPAYEWMARARLKDITQQMRSQTDAGRPLPTRENLGSFLRERYSSKDADMDPWGTPYYLKASRGQVTVVSAGRDRKPGTPDDIASAPVASKR